MNVDVGFQTQFLAVFTNILVCHGFRHEKRHTYSGVGAAAKKSLKANWSVYVNENPVSE